MSKNFGKKLIIGILAFSFLFTLSASAAVKTNGRFLIQVEAKNRLWYVTPSNQRLELSSPSKAWNALYGLAKSISATSFKTLKTSQKTRNANLGQLFKKSDDPKLYYINPLDGQLYTFTSSKTLLGFINKNGIKLKNSALNKIVLLSPKTTTTTPPVIKDPTTPATTTNSNNDLKIQTFTWKYKNKTYTLSENLSTALDKSYSTSPKYLSYPANNPPANIRDSFYALFLKEKSSDQTLDKVLSDLKNLAVQDNLTSDETAEFILAFVQFIPYDAVKAETAEPIPNFLYETLYKNSGICSDKSFLALALLRKLGYGAIILDFPDIKHTAVGIACPTADSTYGDGYCYVETTNYFPIGVIPSSFNSDRSAGTNNDLSKIFKTETLGKVGKYQKTSGQTYSGLSDVKVAVTALQSAKAVVTKSATDLTTAKTALDNSLASANAIKVKLDTAKTAGDITTYNNLVAQYNTAATDYNNKLSAYQTQVSLYNTYVSDYNDKLKAFFQK